MKKKIFTSILLLALLFSLISSSIKTVNNKSQREYSKVLTNNGFTVSPFIYGTTETPSTLDPIDCWDRKDSIIIDQVAETLFTYNYSDPSLPLIPLLATGYDLEPTEKLNFTVYLRQGVIFHDGSEFNSTVAKWNFDRIGYWWNTTGQLPAYETPASTAPLGYWEDGELPIYNRVEIVDEYTIKFVLTKHLAGEPDLLTHSTSAILSMESTPFFSKLTLGTDPIIGTGPFVFDYYDVDNETRFHVFENYWGEKANIEEMLFKYYSDPTSLNLAVLTQDIHFIDNPLPEYLDTFKVNPDLVVIDDGKTDSVARFLVFNNYTLNKTIRKALSYAINYSHITDVIQSGTSTCLKSPIPSGILYSNTTFNYPNFNITEARKIMQSIGHGDTLNASYPGPDDANWETLADTGTFNVSMWVFDIKQFHQDLFTSCNRSFRKIGINLNKKETGWITWATNIQADPNWADIWFMGWLMDYNDPWNVINLLFSNISAGNWMLGYINDSYLQNLIELGTEEFDPVLREGIYDDIQEYIIEDLMPLALLDISKMYHVHHVDLTGFSQNVLEKTYFYSCKWKDSYSISIDTSGDISLVEGSTGNSFTWTITANTIFDPKYEISINDVFNETDIWQNNVPIVVDLDDLSVGTYEFKIEVYNTYKTAEDIVNIEVNPFIFDISHPPDINYTEGDTGNTISWVVTSNLIVNPIYNISRNDTEIESNSWSSGDPIVINVDGLSAGTYEYKIEVRNSDSVKEDIVIVTVNAEEKEIPSKIPGYSLLFVLGITIIIMRYLYKKSKKKLQL